MNDYNELIAALREEAEAVQAIEWDIPICTQNHIREAADVIDKLVRERDAAPVVHGHWEAVKDNTLMSPCYECSVCGRKINTFGVPPAVAPFCHCGAKMDEVSE